VDVSEVWRRSVIDDPSWHARWTDDVLQKWALMPNRLHIVDERHLHGR
jgi:hypothetical protein